MKVNKRLMGDRCTEKGGLNFPVWHRGEMRILGVRRHKGRNNDVEERGERNNKNKLWVKMS